MSEPENEPNPYESPDTESALSSKRTGIPPAAYAGILAAAGVSILIVVALFIFLPGIAVLTALVLVPANLRAIIYMRREFHATGAWPEGWDQASALFLSALIMIPIWIATGIAFSAVCWAGAMIAVSVFPKGDEYGISNMFYGGVPIGLITGLISFVLCFRFTLRTSRTQVEYADDKPESRT
ncbi:hypothetical protein [Bremerella alba]|nr:hypothetical protein [Bremerella alba]